MQSIYIFLLLACLVATFEAQRQSGKRRQKFREHLLTRNNQRAPIEENDRSLEDDFVPANPANATFDRLSRTNFDVNPLSSDVEKPETPSRFRYKEFDEKDEDEEKVKDDIVEGIVRQVVESRKNSRKLRKHNRQTFASQKMPKTTVADKDDDRETTKLLVPFNISSSQLLARSIERRINLITSPADDDFEIEKKELSEKLRSQAYEANPNENLCKVYLDCTLRLEAEKHECENRLIEEERLRQYHFFDDLKKAMPNKALIAGASREMIDYCVLQAMTKYPTLPQKTQFPQLFNDSLYNLERCLSVPNIHICEKSVVSSLIDSLHHSLEEFDLALTSGNISYVHCSGRVNRMIDSCQGLRRCCEKVNNCEKQDTRGLHYARMPALTRVSETILEEVADECLEQAAQAGPFPPSATLSPLRKRIRNHPHFPVKR